MRRASGRPTSSLHPLANDPRRASFVRRARAICRPCEVRQPCRDWARDNREYGFWGGESEEDRAAAGFRVDMPVGRVARYPKGTGSPVKPRESRREVA